MALDWRHEARKAAIAGSTPRMALALAAWCMLSIITLHRAFQAVFVLNFRVEGPGPSAVLVLLLAGAFLAALPARLAPAVRHQVLLGASLIGLLLCSLEDPHLAVVGVAVFHAASFPLARHWAGGLGQDAAMALGLGVLGHMLLRTVLDGVHPFALGLGWLVPLLGILLVAGLDPKGTQRASGSPLVAYIWTMAALLGTADAMATWADGSPWSLAAGAGTGIVAATFIHHPREHLQVAIILPLAVGALVFMPGMGFVWAVLAHGAALVLVRSLLGDLHNGRKDALTAGGIQLLGVLLAFLAVVAGNWAFIGFVPSALSQGLMPLYVFLASLLLLVPRRAAA